MILSRVDDAIKDLQRGRYLIVVDDENRENEGDIVIAAEKVTPSKINFMIKKAGGLICVPIIGERLDELNIPLMVSDSDNTESTRCKFTVSVDYKLTTTTGISASDRCKTIKALINSKSLPKDFAKPGHIFPLRYEEGGVLKREGHTEAAVDLCKIANLYPAAVICEILKDDGESARLADLIEYAEKHKLNIISVEELMKYRRSRVEIL